MSKKKGGPKTGKKSKHRFSFKEKAAKPEKPSPFAMRSSKLKFDILGRKVKGDKGNVLKAREAGYICLLYTSPSPRDKRQSRMPSSA